MRYIILFAIVFSLGAQSAVSQSAQPFTTNYRRDFPSLFPYFPFTPHEHAPWLTGLTLMASWLKNYQFDQSTIVTSIQDENHYYYSLVYENHSYLDMLYFEEDLAQQFGLVMEAPRSNCLTARDIDHMLQSYGPLLFLDALNFDQEGRRWDIVSGWIIQGMSVDQHHQIYLDVVELPHGSEMTIPLCQEQDAGHPIDMQMVDLPGIMDQNAIFGWLNFCIGALGTRSLSVFHYPR